MCGCKGLFTRLKLKKPLRLNAEGLDDAKSYFPYLERLLMSGGETLLFPEFKKILKIANKYPHIEMGILTNGTLINDSWIETFLKINLKTIVISIDAATKNTYRKIRVRGKFDNVINSIRKINDQKNNSHPDTIMAFVIMKRNFHEIIDFLELAHKIGAKKVAYQMMWNARFMFYLRENVSNDKNSCSKVLKYGDKLRDLADDYDMEVQYRAAGNLLQNKPNFFFEHYGINQSDLNDDEGFECDQFWKNLDISPNYFTSCVFSAQRKWEPLWYYSQNNQKTPKIIDAWNCEKIQNARKLVASNQFTDTCKLSCPRYFKHKTKNVI
jgi:MoaA/NifB/PqqE/SkfB family radical SAM enzyme